MQIMCKKIAEDIQEEIKAKATGYKRKPKLATILVGERADSQAYVRNKEKTLGKVGFEYETFTFPEEVTQDMVEFLIERLVKDKTVDGILVQLPLPKHLDADSLIELIPYYKDVDGLTAPNQAKLFMGEKWDNFVQPCTPLGICKILDDVLEEPKRMLSDTGNFTGFNVAVLGRSNLLGNPLAQMLMRKNYTVTQMHSKSDMNLLEDLKPDVVCLCTGQKDLLTAYDIAKYGLDETLFALIDAGIMRDENGLRGDFKKEDYYVFDKCDIAYTSVPGGVGVLTTTMLAYNLAKCYELHMKSIPNL